ncbi:MAG TPA: anthranilate synthase component I [Candidatus Obscuribacterales bacterium]
MAEKLKQMQPWYWRSLPLENRTGSDVFDALFRNAGEIATLLESPYPTPTQLGVAQNATPMARYSICAGSPRIVKGKTQVWTPALGQILPFLRRLLQSSGVKAKVGASPPQNYLPFTGGWLGWLGYDLAWEIEKLPNLNKDPLPFPVAFWYEPESFAVLDHWQQTLWLASTNEAELDQLEQGSRKAGSVGAGTGENLNTNSRLPSLLSSQLDYEDAVRQAQKYIHAGDIFQANLSLRFEAYTTADSWAIYRALQQINPSPFASYWQTPWGAVVSSSPERLVHLEGLEAQTRPIAGTRSRGSNPEQDSLLEQELIANAKERAEHIMLVDLERNDLGRVSEWGSVEVNELLTIERYSHVMHLVSNVRGTLRPDCDPVDLIRALFPGGTITGCPKVRCMEIIEELEPVRRNLFYGSCGYLDWRGNLDLNILIRTLLVSRENIPTTEQITDSSTPHESGLNIVWGQVGAGIVADSDPEKEWYESLHKAQAQLAALKLAENC